MTRPRLPRFYVYLLLSERGEIYTGETNNIRRRFKEHNSCENQGWTRGRRWYLLAVQCFLDRDSAILTERQLKRSRYDKRNWLRHLARQGGRLRTLCGRHGISHRMV